MVDTPLEDGWFNLGTLTWLSGESAGTHQEVAEWTQDDSRMVLYLPPQSGKPNVGDIFSVVAGCDKRIETCSQRFNNILNYRGEPYIPGETVLDGDQFGTAAVTTFDIRHTADVPAGVIERGPRDAAHGNIGAQFGSPIPLIFGRGSGRGTLLWARVYTETEVLPTGFQTAPRSTSPGPAPPAGPRAPSVSIFGPDQVRAGASASFSALANGGDYDILRVDWDARSPGFQYAIHRRNPSKSRPFVGFTIRVPTFASGPGRRRLTQLFIELKVTASKRIAGIDGRPLSDTTQALKHVQII